MEKENNEKQNSIKVSKLANGKYSWEIKIYFDEANPINNIENIDKQLQEKFSEKEDEKRD